jgi:hypothetical protein
MSAGGPPGQLSHVYAPEPTFNKSCMASHSVTALRCSWSVGGTSDTAKLPERTRRCSSPDNNASTLIVRSIIGLPQPRSAPASIGWESMCNSFTPDCRFVQYRLPDDCPRLIHAQNGALARARSERLPVLGPRRAPLRRFVDRAAAAIEKLQVCGRQSTILSHLIRMMDAHLVEWNYAGASLLWASSMRLSGPNVPTTDGDCEPILANGSH